MQRFVITLEDQEGNNHEAHLRMPEEVADRVSRNDMEILMEALFSEAGYEVVHIEECEEIRHVMNRRWDDPKPVAETE